VIYEGPDIRIGSDRIDWRAGTPWGDGQKRIINAIIVQCQNEIRWHMRADGYPSRTEIPHKASAPFTSTIIIIIADRPTDRPTGFDGIKYFRCLCFWCFRGKLQRNTNLQIQIDAVALSNDKRSGHSPSANHSPNGRVKFSGVVGNSKIT